MEIQELKDIASQVRRDIVRQVHSCQSGHPGGSLGCTDVVVSLYFDVMKINEEKGEDGCRSALLHRGTIDDLPRCDNR